MQTRKQAKLGNLFTVVFDFRKGDEAEIETNGSDNGDGTVDTRCHCAFYASGLFETTYGNGDVRLRSSGQTGTEDDLGAKGKHNYPAGKIKIRALEAGKIIFILQKVETHTMEWGYGPNPKAQYHVDLDGNFTNDGPFWFDLVKK